ncbi:MAG: glycosyltransferase family 2 protein [Chloroflexi bacterium]|nr:glycosyltransferase family 2 protein [Chloroflexota bacterium]
MEELAMIRPEVSVVICAYTEQRWDQLVEAVASVRRQTLPPGEIVIIVDHNEKLLVRLRRALPSVRSVASRGERGLSGARNTGIGATTGEWIAFLDDDAVAAPDWLARLSSHWADHATMGVGGKVQPLWQADRPRWFPEEFDWVVGCSYRGLPESAAPVRNLLGANMCLRRDIFDAVGGFRSSMGRVGTNEAGCEETELCIRGQQRWKSRRFIYEPLARVYHHVPAARARWRYYSARCYAEGISKARVARLVGVEDGLAAERSHAFRNLPRGIVRGIADSARHREPFGLMMAGAILAGLSLATVGYLVGRLHRYRIGVRQNRHEQEMTLGPLAPGWFELRWPGDDSRI